MKRRIWTQLLWALGMLVLILDAETAMAGAREGLQLCLRSVIVSLFPCLVLSMMLTSSLSGTRIARPVGRLCGIPEGAEPLLLIGLLGGYPVGAQNTAQAYERGLLTKKQAKRLLSFCSNPGPAFIFGICGSQFSSGWAAFGLWLIQIASALAVGMLLPEKENACTPMRPAEPLKLTEAMHRGIQVMAGICGWVVLFRVIIAFADKWLLHYLSHELQVIIAGFLELTNGCCTLERISAEPLRFVAAAAMLSFGGLCVAMQTASVTGQLGTASYLKGKLLQTVISTAMAAAVVYRPFTPGFLLAVLAIVLREMKKRSSIMQTVGV